MSWSQKLFLTINNMVGKNKLRDRFLYFCGQWLIWVLVLINIILFPIGLYAQEMVGFLKLFTLATGVSYGLSYLIALWFPHSRPIVEHPQIKELIVPLGTWKSFPSDHTIGAVLLATSAYFLSAGDVLPFAVLALLVMAGRVYCGVHYPRDIVGGIIVAGIGIGVTMSVWAFFALQYTT